MFITALHYIKQSLNRWRIYIPNRTAGIHYFTSKEVSYSWPFLAVCKSCSDVSHMCHEIAIKWQLGTFAYDDLVIRCHYRMICTKSEAIQQLYRSLSSEFELV